MQVFEINSKTFQMKMIKTSFACVILGGVLSDQVHSEIPGGQFLCFNAKFTYLKIFDITRDFYSAEEYSSIVQKVQHKENKAIAVHS